MPGAKGGQSEMPRGVKKKRGTCVYDEGGLCHLHGMVGTLKWKPKNVITAGQDGKMKCEYQRVEYYECDTILGGGGGRQRQSKRSTKKTAVSQTPKLINSKFNFSTSTEGQSTPVRDTQTDLR